MPRPHPGSATCTAGVRATSSCGTTAPPCIAAGHGPRTRRGSWCARPFPPLTRTGSGPSARRHGRRRNKHASLQDRGTLVAAHEPARCEPTSWSGLCLHIHITESAPARVEGLDEAKLTAGRGIEGVRYFNGIGTFSPKPDVREVTLIEMEVLDAMARGGPPFPGEKVEVAPAEHRRNLTKLGVPLSHIVDKSLRVGGTVLGGGRMNFPCKYLEKLLARPVYTALLNRSGLNCRIELGGNIRKGDPITPLDD